ncbi:acylphosphatase, partial [Anaerosalibacter bizertensis]|nr:acylphosphatase [Anaerosalibacter bizertensis]
KRKKYRTFLQDSETGEEIAEEYEKGRGVWKKHDVQDGKGSEMRENLIRKHYWFSGRVQGVGFRYRACYIASSLGVTGWVRNNRDDRVEMEAQGSRELLAQMV